VSSCGISLRSSPPVASHVRVFSAARRISTSEAEKSKGVVLTGHSGGTTTIYGIFALER